MTDSPPEPKRRTNQPITQDELANRQMLHTEQPLSRAGIVASMVERVVVVVGLGLALLLFGVYFIGSTFGSHAMGSAEDKSFSDPFFIEPIEAQTTETASDEFNSEPTREGLIGSWVQAERGGEDGHTDCGDAELMITFNGGTTEALQFYRNGRVDYVLWYDTAFESRGEPQVKSAYNAGTWTLEGSELSIVWRGGNTGLFGADLGSGDAEYSVSIDGNVMVQSIDGASTRLVRCR